MHGQPFIPRLQGSGHYGRRDQRSQSPRYLQQADALLSGYDIRSRAFRITTYLRPSAIKSSSERVTIGAVQVIPFVCLETYYGTDISSPDESPAAANYNNNILHLGRQRYRLRSSLTDQLYIPSAKSEGVCCRSCLGSKTYLKA